LKPSAEVRNLSEAEIQQELNALAQEESVGLLSHLQRIRASLYLAFDIAAQHGDEIALARLSGQLHANLRLAAEKTGELEKHTQTQINNLVVAPDYLNLRTRLIAALRNFPEARQAVAEVFREMEAPVQAPAAQPVTQPPAPTRIEHRPKKLRGEVVDIDLAVSECFKENEKDS